jgi:hypothetical protein
VGNGSVAPYGSTASGFASSQAVIHRHTHRLINDTHHLMSELTRSRTKITDLEAELKALRATVAANASNATPSATTTATTTAASSSVNGESKDTIPTTAGASVPATSSSAVNGTTKNEEHYEMMTLNHDGTAVAVPTLLHQTSIDNTVSTNVSSSSLSPSTTTDANSVASSINGETSIASSSSSATSSLLSSLLGDDDSSSHDALLGTTRLSNGINIMKTSNPFDDTPSPISSSDTQAA